MRTAKPWTLVVLQAWVSDPTGPVRFFATGPGGAIGNVSGKGTEADPWRAFVPDPAFGT